MQYLDKPSNGDLRRAFVVCGCHLLNGTVGKRAPFGQGCIRLHGTAGVFVSDKRERARGETSTSTGLRYAGALSPTPTHTSHPHTTHHTRHPNHLGIEVRGHQRRKERERAFTVTVMLCWRHVCITVTSAPSIPTCISNWFTAGAPVVVTWKISSRCLGMKFDTPIARHLPARFRYSSARQVSWRLLVGLEVGCAVVQVRCSTAPQHGTHTHTHTQYKVHECKFVTSFELHIELEKTTNKIYPNTALCINTATHARSAHQRIDARTSPTTPGQ